MASLVPSSWPEDCEEDSKDSAELLSGEESDPDEGTGIAREDSGSLLWMGGVLEAGTELLSDGVDISEEAET